MNTFKRHIPKIIINLFIFTVLVFPAMSLAVDPPPALIPCGTDANPKPCEFNDLMKLINNIVWFILFRLAIPIAAIMFIYAGFTLITAGGSTEARSKAKGIFTNTAIGLVIAAAAWLIVHLILSTLGYTGESFGLN